MNLTRQHLKELIKEQISEMEKEQVEEQQEQSEEDPDLMFAGIKQFAAGISQGKAIQAQTIEKAIKEMRANPNVGTIAQFVSFLLKAFGIDQSEFTNITQKVKTDLDK
jgi:maleate cis-trans isomerase